MASETFQSIASRKIEAIEKAIPPAWRLTSPPPSSQLNVLSVPSTCGILSSAEIEITTNHDATALAAAIRARKLKVFDVVLAFCKRAAIAHQLVNCITEPLFNAALHRAAHLDTHFDDYTPLPPLFGLPISVKDQFKISGTDASIGLAGLCFKPSAINSPLVDLLLAQGAVIICKTNMPQTGMALDSVNNIFGRTLNPINRALTAGGSSGGEAALVALHGSALGVGTDIGGSIRIPAYVNGLYGFKPSADRVPYSEVESAAAEPGGSSIGVSASAGPIARSLRDCELFMRAVANGRPFTYDPSVIPGLWEHTDFSTSSQSRKLTIGILLTDGLITPLPPVTRTINHVATRLASAGHTVVPLAPPSSLSKANSLANALFGIEGGNDTMTLLHAHAEPLIPWLARTNPKMQSKPPKTYAQIRHLHAQRIALAAEMNTALWRAGGREVDAIVCPVAGHAPPPHDTWAGVNFTAPWVLLDYAAGVVPIASQEVSEADMAVVMPEPARNRFDAANRALWDDEAIRRKSVGAPMGVQVLAPRLQELRCYKAMLAVDQACNGVKGESGAGKVLGDGLGGMVGAKL